MSATKTKMVGKFGILARMRRGDLPTPTGGGGAVFEDGARARHAALRELWRSGKIDPPAESSIYSPWTLTSPAETPAPVAAPVAPPTPAPANSKITRPEPEVVDFRFVSRGEFTYRTKAGNLVAACFTLSLIRTAWNMGCDFEDLADGFGPGAGTHGDWSAIRDSSIDAENAMLARAMTFLGLLEGGR